LTANNAASDNTAPVLLIIISQWLTLRQHGRRHRYVSSDSCRAARHRTHTPVVVKTPTI